MSCVPALVPLPDVMQLLRLTVPWVWGWCGILALTMLWVGVVLVVFVFVFDREQRLSVRDMPCTSALKDMSAVVY